MKASLDDPTVVEALCSRIASGESIKEVCISPDMPDKATVYRHMAADPEFATRIARAREAQQDHEAELCVELADSATPDDWQVVKLRIWARQWRASKLAPKKYGDKVMNEHSGPNGGPMQVQQFQVEFIGADKSVVLLGDFRGTDKD